MTTENTPTVEPSEQDYQDAKYPRSDLKFVRMPLAPFMKDSHSFLGEQLEGLIYGLPKGVIIAGGFPAALLTGRKDAADIDLWFPNSHVFEGAVGNLLANNYHPTEVDKEVVGAYQVKFGESLDKRAVLSFQRPRVGFLPVQCIKLAWFESAEHVLDCFDFTVTQVAVDIATKELVVNPVALAHLHEKVLVVHRKEGDQAFQKRLAKYMAKGYRIEPQPAAPQVSAAPTFDEVLS